MTTLVPSPAITDLDAVTDSDCVFMGEDAHWGSVKVGGNFTWNVIED